MQGRVGYKRLSRKLDGVHPRDTDRINDRHGSHHRRFHKKGIQVKDILRHKVAIIFDQLHKLLSDGTMTTTDLELGESAIAQEIHLQCAKAEQV
jgi:hypothetical protein